MQNAVCKIKILFKSQSQRALLRPTDFFLLFFFSNTERCHVEGIQSFYNVADIFFMRIFAFCFIFVCL